ncbi:TPA: hypothetical protein UO481_000905 [Klebsiella pneumoniae]|nr:hypothetical protein [Klebsiella pneumoniae]
MNSVLPICENTDINNEHLKTFCRQINANATPLLVPVIPTPLPFANCYWNVEAVVGKFGGRFCLGWDISSWPGSHLSAVHHAVYLDAHGNLHDVTERQQGSSDMNNTIFLPDTTFSINLNSVPAISMKFFVIKESNEVNNYISAYQRFNKTEKEISKFIYDLGFRCESNRAIAMGQPIPYTTIPGDKVAVYQDIDARMNKAKQKITETIISLRGLTEN